MNETYAIHPDVVFRRLGEQMVLVHLSTNQVFELNTTGATIEVTQESVVATLMELVGPSLRDVFQTAIPGQKE